jgi:putative transposase
MLRAVKVRLYPNKEQEQELNKVLGAYRFVYNQMLAKRLTAYETDKLTIGANDLSKWFYGTLRKDGEYAWLREQNAHVMNQAINQMDDDYQKFFKQNNGFPKFKAKKDNQSVLLPRDAVSKCNTFETQCITLTTSIQNLKFSCSDLYHSRLQKYKDSIRSATILKTKSGDFFLSILIDIPESELGVKESMLKQQDL